MSSLIASLKVFNIFAENTWNLGGLESPVNFNADATSDEKFSGPMDGDKGNEEKVMDFDTEKEDDIKENEQLYDNDTAIETMDSEETDKNEIITDSLTANLNEDEPELAAKLPESLGLGKSASLENGTADASVHSKPASLDDTAEDWLSDILDDSEPPRTTGKSRDKFVTTRPSTDRPHTSIVGDSNDNFEPDGTKEEARFSLLQLKRFISFKEADHTEALLDSLKLVNNLFKRNVSCFRVNIIRKE